MTDAAVIEGGYLARQQWFRGTVTSEEFKKKAIEATVMKLSNDAFKKIGALIGTAVGGLGLGTYIGGVIGAIVGEVVGWVIAKWHSNYDEDSKRSDLIIEAFHFLDLPAYHLINEKEVEKSFRKKALDCHPDSVRVKTRDALQRSIAEVQWQLLQHAKDVALGYFKNRNCFSQKCQDTIKKNYDSGDRKTATFNELKKSLDESSKSSEGTQFLIEDDSLVFFVEATFLALLKGVIDIHGKMSEPFTLLVNLGPRNPEFDSDHTLYSSYLALHVGHHKAWFSMKKNGQQILLDWKQKDAPGMTLGLDSDTITTYWLSYDRDNMVVKYGKGYTMEETTLLTCNFMDGVTNAEQVLQKRKEWSLFFDVCHPDRTGETILLYRTVLDIEKNQEMKIDGEACSFIHMEPMIAIRKQPLITNPPPKVLDAAHATLENIDNEKYTLSSALPPPCKALYDTVRHVKLDPAWDTGESDVSFIDAIRFSINTEGCKLHELLKTKKYLRITMGTGHGDSPGNAYVLEIWPPGAISPIHNHGAVCGIVKILHGKIQNGVFNKVPSNVCDRDRNFRPTELMKIEGRKDDVFWLSPEW